MRETLDMYFKEKDLRKIAHRCDKVLGSGYVTAHYAWYGTSVGGGVSVWQEFIQRFLNIYKKRYDAGYHEMVAAATLLSLADVYGIDSDCYNDNEHKFACNLNKSCQMGELGNYEYLPICKIEHDRIITKALKSSALRNNFTVKVKCCDKEDGDPRTARDIRVRKIEYKI